MGERTKINIKILNIDSVKSKMTTEEKYIALKKWLDTPDDGLCPRCKKPMGKHWVECHNCNWDSDYDSPDSLVLQYNPSLSFNQFLEKYKDEKVLIDIMYYKLKNP